MIKIRQDQYQVFRSVCPRNCYGTCGMLSYVQDGKLVKVEGDPKHGYTKGRLCAKGYAYSDYVYHPDRLRYPLKQSPRGSGQWQRISWDEALTEIAHKILELESRYGSNLALSYNKYSGNLGFLHYAVEGMFHSFGQHTKSIGNPCLSAGGDALFYDYGAIRSPDPESMTDAKLIVIWGVNPAWTSVHQFHFINMALDRGALLVVIDPLFTPTAAKADFYLQIQPGTDGLLALVILKIMMEKGFLKQDIFTDHVTGWESFASYLEKEIHVEAAAEEIGIDIEAIYELAGLFSDKFPIANWVGFGMQRHANGGQMVRAVNALTVLTGNLGVKGGGLFYYHPQESYFPNSLSNLTNSAEDNRMISLNDFAREALELDDPPVKFLWIACRNPLSQDIDPMLWVKLMDRLEMIVTVDLFMTRTAEKSDIVLPAASHFEEMDVNVGYWHRWVGINEKAIAPFYEAKSDLQIARELTRKLNELSPGFSSFPNDLSPEDWIAKEFIPETMELFGLNSWEELKEGPRKLLVDTNPWGDLKFQTKDEKYSLYSSVGKDNDMPAIPRYKSLKSPGEYPLLLITPQHLSRIHSQYKNINGLLAVEANLIEINPETAALRKVTDGDRVNVYNEIGSYVTHAKLNPYIPKNVVMTYQSGSQSINQLIPHLPTDMGEKNHGRSGVAFYDVFVNIEKSKGDMRG